LESMGYGVVIARDGQEALAYARQETFDAVVTDIVMPKMDGIELITSLRQEKAYQDVPIIVLSTRQDEVDKKRGLEAGADAYLSKGDFSAEIMLETLERLLG
jgi:two-component system, chemotaxis family, sensor kinase CheA